MSQTATPRIAVPALAADAATTYDDIFMRSTTSDQGSIPAPSPLCTSPDIIPMSTPVANPQTYFVNTYGQDLGGTVLANQQNYIYVRGKNLAAGAQSGTVQLHWTKASLIMWPSIWGTQTLKSGSGASSVSVSAANAGDVVVGSDAFEWAPADPGPNDHYCLVGRVITAQHPNPVPTTINTADDFANYVANNRGVGWRNVVVVDQNTPTFQVTVNLQSPTQQELHIFLDVAGLPIGSQVGFTSAGVDINGQPVSMAPVTILSNGGESHGIVVTLPAGFNDDITYSFWANGQAYPSGISHSIALRAVYVPPSTSAMAAFARPIRYRDARAAADVDSIPIVTGVVIGDHTARIQ